MLTPLYSFTDLGDGASPETALVQGSDGYFYGTTTRGGTNGAGTVFKISPSAALTTLYSFFNGGGISPSGLVQGSDGNFYGTTHCDGFQGTQGGPMPPHPAVPYGDGTVFKIDTNGAYTILYWFDNDNGTKGAGPNGLVQGSDGNFYGTTYQGGAAGAGTIFRLTIVPDPQLTIIPSGPYVILTWPTNSGAFNYAGYTLQSTTNLVSPVWTANSPGPVVIGGQNVVINTICGTQKFYRLIQ